LGGKRSASLQIGLTGRENGLLGESEMPERVVNRKVTKGPVLVIERGQNTEKNIKNTATR